MNVLKKLSENVIDSVWEDLIFDRCTDLPTLMEVQNIDEKWLPHLRAILGFTSNLSFDATTEELRRILALAVPYWNEKPTELGVVKNAIRMITGNRFRVANWFDFRMQIDKTVITEELEDFDPYVVGFPSNKFTGDDADLTSTSDFVLNDYVGTFTSTSEFGWLIIENSGTNNDGIYEIKELVVGTKEGVIKGSWPTSPESSLDWKLLGYASEYTTEVRLVDEGVGTLPFKSLAVAFTVGARAYGVTSDAYGIITAVGSSSLSLRSINGRFEHDEILMDTLGGEAVVDRGLQDVLNRTLLDFLMGGRTVKPFSERIDIVYINFLEQFLTPGDLDQWDTTGTVTVPAPGGAAELLASATIFTNNVNQQWWTDQVTAWKFTATGATTVINLVFMGTDSSNYYYVKMDYANKQVSLWKLVAATPTQLGSTINLSYLKVDVSDVVRVDALDAGGSGTLIRVKVNGDLKLDELDGAGAFDAGFVGAVAAVGPFSLHLVEVNVIPTEIQRVGPLP
jgi:hypothetical protein